MTSTTEAIFIFVCRHRLCQNLPKMQGRLKQKLPSQKLKSYKSTEESVKTGVDSKAQYSLKTTLLW